MPHGGRGGSSWVLPLSFFFSALNPNPAAAKIVDKCQNCVDSKQNQKRERERERKVYYKTTGGKDDYGGENSWISDGLTSSSRRRRRGEGRGEGGEWKEKWSASGVDVGVDSAKSEIKVERS